MYDDPDVPVNGDADEWSRLLRQAHRQLWSKALPDGEQLQLADDLTIQSPTVVAGVSLSSDTIATTHQRYRYRGMDSLFAKLPPAAQKRYDRGFYAIGGFTVFPRHDQSINQLRGRRRAIDDRFDLTLECIRLFYNGIADIARNPLGDVLQQDRGFYDLFGEGVRGFDGFVRFFHFDGLVEDGRIRWLDGADCDGWAFGDSRLPTRAEEYVSYLERVLRFVEARSRAIAVAVGRAI
jgi:hypothetical protein